LLGLGHFYFALTVRNLLFEIDSKLKKRARARVEMRAGIRYIAKMAIMEPGGKGACAESTLDYPQIPNLRVGTSSWSSQDWVGVFYPAGTAPADFIAEYAKHFDIVEVDSTFYRTPSVALVRSWGARTPAGFLLAAKFPLVITHEKVLVDCASELAEFLNAMDHLGDKLGPLLLQFPYFNKQAFPQPQDFLVRLAKFLDQLPRGRAYAIELRNKYWINDRLLDLLRARNISLALIDHPWMTPADQLVAKQDMVTAGFVYLRWLGDRKGIEERTKHWDSVIIDRRREMETWIRIIRALLKRGLRILGFFNNHYAGFAPGSVKLFYEVWERMGAADE
jgi:uncharacterized protein YecE (DUF72 family)